MLFNSGKSCSKDTTTLSTMAFCLVAFRIMTLSIQYKNVTVSITFVTVMLSVVTQSVVVLSFSYSECRK